MKNMIKSLLIAVCMISAVSVSAQESAPAAKASDFSVGDTIVIKKDHERYLTGEKMSKWVYNVDHTIQQIGSKRFPEGILIRGIISWVGPDDIENKSEHHEDAEEQAAKQAAAQQAKQQAQEQEQKEGESEAQQGEEQQQGDDDTSNVAVDDSNEVEESQSDSTAIADAEREAAAQARRDSLLNAWKQAQDSSEAAYQVDKEKQQKFNCNRFTIGLRGGAASLMHKSDNPNSEWKIGFDAMLDLQYAHYWKKFDKKMQYGLLLGVSAGYAQSSFSCSADNALPRVSTSDGNIDYQISAESVKEANGQLQLEIPIMFSMVHEKGFFMNIGPRIGIPVAGWFNQKITDPKIVATFVEEGVPVTNALITGVVSEDQAKSSGKWKPATMNLMLGAELGYEHAFANKNSLSIGVYGGYSVYTLYNNDVTGKSIITIDSAPATGKPAVVGIHSATESYVSGLGYFDVGLKLAFHFNWWK